MADISNNQKNTVGIENITTGYDLVVNSNGSLNTDSLLHYQVRQDAVFTLSGSFNAAVGGADNGIFLIKNPSGSGKTLRLRKMYVGCTVNNVFVEFKIFYAPTITLNGTSQTPRNNLIGSSTASIATAFSLPTLSVLGTQILDFTVGQNSTGPEINLALDVRENQNVLVTASPGSNNRQVQLTVVWAEV